MPIPQKTTPCSRCAHFRHIPHDHHNSSPFITGLAKPCSQVRIEWDCIVLSRCWLDRVLNVQITINKFLYPRAALSFHGVIVGLTGRVHTHNTRALPRPLRLLLLLLLRWFARVYFAYYDHVSDYHFPLLPCGSHPSLTTGVRTNMPTMLLVFIIVLSTCRGIGISDHTVSRLNSIFIFSAPPAIFFVIISILWCMFKSFPSGCPPFLS